MKKKLFIFLMSFSLLSGITACGENKTNSNENSAKKEDTNQKTSKEDKPAPAEDTKAEKESTVEFTLPATYVGNQTQEDLDKMAAKYGSPSVTLNSDGSATFKMTQEQHKEFLEKYREEINKSIQETYVGTENYPNITKVETNDSFTEFTITTKSAKLDMNESLSTIVFKMYGGIYSLFSGEEIDDVSITFINADTGEVIHSSGPEIE